METEQAKHETEESLMLAQFGTSHNISHKLQNGGQSSEGDSLQVTGDANWIPNPAHYKSSKGANSMKRYRENNISPMEQGLFDQGSYKMNGDLMNGELKHALAGQSLLAHQPKKMKIDGEIKGNNDTSPNVVAHFPELSKANEFECSSPRMEVNLDKRNCHFPNGDIFCLPRNKQVQNGAVSPSSTIESTPGDLLEKTLSQYYPEQVSIAPQTSGSQLDTVNDSLTNQLSSEGAQTPALTSGLPNSAQMPDSQTQQPEGGNNYNSVNYIVNGYSNSFAGDHQQQPQHHQQQPLSYSGQEPALGQPSGTMPPTNNANSTPQHLNGARCFPDDRNPQGIYMKTQQEFNHSSFLKCSNPLQAAEAGGYGSFPDSGIQQIDQSETPGSGQLLQHSTEKGLQYGNQTTTFQENAGKQHRDDGMGNIGPGFQQPHHTGIENGIESAPQQRANISCSTPSQRGWLDQNPSHSQQQPTSGLSSQAQEQDMWRGFPAKPQPEQQTVSPQVHSQILEPNTVQRFQSQGVFTDSSRGSNSIQQQDCLPTQMQFASVQHNTATKWQQSNCKAAQMQQPQQMHEKQNFPKNQQAENLYHSQIESEHLHENTDRQDILSPGFVTTQQQHQQQHCHLQRPLSHPPQFEGQQLKSPNYRPHSQPPPGLHQPQPNQPLRNHSAQPSNQDILHSDHVTFIHSNTTEMQQPQQHQSQYQPNSGSRNLKQFQSQQPNNHCQEPNQVDFPQTSAQSQPHLPQGAINQQTTTQMHPKAEQQLKPSCTQFQRGLQLPPGPVGPNVDFQRHAALRMHLLQRQERQGLPHHPQSSSDHKQILRAVKMENGPNPILLPVSRQQEQLLQMREAGMGGMQVKQENQQSLCNQSKKQGSILDSMEQSLRQYQMSPVFEKKSLAINSSYKVKVESAGPVTILSTNTDVSGAESSTAASSTVALRKSTDSTPKKEQLLQTFVDSPIKLLDTPIKNLLDTPMKTQYDIPSCHCVEQIVEKDEGPYYTHLGSAPSVPGIRELMEKRLTSN